jgi:hypothetical protein
LANLEKGRSIAAVLRRRDPEKIQFKALEVAMMNQTGLTLGAIGRSREALDVYRKETVPGRWQTLPATLSGLALVLPIGPDDVR